MVIGKVSAVNIPAPLLEVKTSSFKGILKRKQASISNGIEQTIAQVSRNHENSTRSLKSFMTEKNLSPTKLLAVQYETGILLLREQMFCKTAELCSNSLKNFTQMQV